MKRAIAACLIVSSLAAGPVHARETPSWASFTPGMSLPAVREILTSHRARLRTDGQMSRLETDRPLFREIFESQRARFLFDENERLSELRIEITPRRGAEAAEILALWRDGRASLLRRLGRPTREASPSLATADEVMMAISSGSAELLIEWHDEARTIRFGAPRRISGEIVLELLISHGL
jgi:hypothetical protein